MVYDVQKGSHYLLGRHFIIKTDHFSLKHLLDQRISTLMQQKWLTKLLGYDYEILFKYGQEKGLQMLYLGSLVRVLHQVQHYQLFNQLGYKVFNSLFNKIQGCRPSFLT